MNEYSHSVTTLQHKPTPHTLHFHLTHVYQLLRFRKITHRFTKSSLCPRFLNESFVLGQPPNTVAFLSPSSNPCNLINLPCIPSIRLCGMVQRVLLVRSNKQRRFLSSCGCRRIIIKSATRVRLWPTTIQCFAND